VTTQRISTTHGPRVDDELKHETSSLEQGSSESRTDEGRSHEDGAAGEQHAGLDASEGLPDDPALARRDLSRHLRSSVFPADRSALLAEAEGNHAPDAIVTLLRRLPGAESWDTVYEVWDALGGDLEPAEREVLAERGRDDPGDV
jgi:hypothetical protein